MATLVGIDYGNRKIGFAVGQSVTATAKPLAVIRQNGEMWKQINKIFQDWQPQLVVVGKPELADGKLHPLEKMIENFIYELKIRYNADVYRVNEAYTSFEAHHYQDGKIEKKQPLDAYAAAIMLESWMRTNGV